MDLVPSSEDCPTFGQFAMNLYQNEWEAYRLRKKKLIFCGIAVFLGVFPFLSLVAFIDRKLFSSTSMVFPASLVWAAFHMSIWFRLRVFSCPRYGRNFSAGIFHKPADLLVRPNAFLGRQCVHCGLRKFAESHEDVKQTSSHGRLERAVVSIPVSNALKNILGGCGRNFDSCVDCVP